MAAPDSLTALFGPVISTYSRKQALEDGILVDVSTVAREAGFRWPVALTRTVWGQYVEVPQGVQCQDEQGRLWDILWMARARIKASSSDSIRFQLYVRNHNRAPLTRRDLITLRATVSPGDDGDPVITIMLPGED
jgi:hypothetical protein